jgi:hypothetical protein
MRIKRILFNLAALVPGVSGLSVVKRKVVERSLGTGGSSDARYCYSVWLRHLVKCAENLGITRCPAVVAEFGPGDSIGMGLAALLSGAREYRAFDVVQHANLARNVKIFDELVALFMARAPIPDAKEFPSVVPQLDSYEFPAHLLSEAVLAETLDRSRVSRIRANLSDPASVESFVSYVAPWRGSGVLAERSVDWIMSQAVLEHIDELGEAYAVMARWLRPGGWMSHSIDFSSHGSLDQWNGQWACSDFLWRVLRGPDIWFINRAPLSEHRQLARSVGFSEMLVETERRHDGIRRSQLARRFSGIADDDLETASAFVVLSRST